MILTATVTLEGDEREVEAFYEQMNEGLVNMVEDGEDDVIVQVRREEEERCAECGASMFVRVRGHHHSIDGRDVTSDPVERMYDEAFREEA